MLHSPDDLLQDLTPQQRAAVEHDQGPLLILAGPGSGKTRVITRRIARLLHSGVRAKQILAITFTNKAAGEMVERVQHLVPDSHVWISTFHRFCARLLRRYGTAIGLRSNFSILDSSDQRQGIRLLLHDLDFDPVHFPPEKVLWRISNAKNDLITAEDYVARMESMVADHWQGVVRRVYPAYQKWLLDSNAVDFDDLLMHTVTLLSENPELRAELDERYTHVLVDEYQDTNRAQYQIVAALSQDVRNLCVTGDPDQSIYGWRGARIENILNFERDYPEASVIRLEANFRSTRAILRSADALIAHNTQRRHKELLTERDEGKAVQLLRFPDSAAEADGIARRIRALVESGEHNWNEFAIFYRVNSLSSMLERAFSRWRIPFEVAAGVAFFERAEIRDLIAYLRLIENPADQSAFQRVVNKPLRGLGKTSQARLLDFIRSSRISPLEGARRADEVPGLSRKARAGFRAFAEMMHSFSPANSGSVADLLTQVVDRTRYAAPWEGESSEDAIEHLANIQELISLAAQYDAGAGDDPSLQGFLELTALASDTDRIDSSAGRVTLMTLHAAKGLEFPVVFILGLEDGLIPHERSLRENDRREIEEERRLLFVGVTRAREQLYLTTSAIRSMHGRPVLTIPSSFLHETTWEEIDCSAEGGDTLWQNSGLAEAGFSSPPAETGIDSNGFSEESSPEALEQRRSSPGAPNRAASSRPLLTTGAALLNGDTSPARLPVGYGVGQRVEHPRYGCGTIVETSGFGARRTVTVLFDDASRSETFMTSKAPLKPA